MKWPDLRKFSPAALFILNLALIMLLGVADYVTAPEIAILYLVPIAVSAWFIGAGPGTALSLVSAAIWLYDDLITRYPEPDRALAYWEAFVRLGFFLVVTYVLVRLRRALSTEKRLSRTDNLTGIANGRRFLELFAFELDKLRRYGHPVTLLYMDVDEFKTVNDTRGHSAGDELLRLVAATLRRNTRAADLPARLGGDEFAVLLPETGYDRALETVEKVQRHLLAAVSLGDFPVTFSIGAVTFAEAPRSVDEALKAADDLMYAAKRGGKNAVRHAVVGRRRPRETAGV